MSLVRPPHAGAAALVALMLAAPGLPAAADPPAAEAAGIAAVSGAEPMVLSVVLNGDAKGDYFLSRTDDGDFLMRAGDLGAIGVILPASVTATDDDALVSLRSLPDVAVAFDERKLLLAISAKAGALPQQLIDYQPRRRIKSIIPDGSSAFLNYGLSYSGSDDARPEQLTMANEAAIAVSGLTFQSSSDFSYTGGHGRFVRLLTSLTHDDRNTLRRTTLGDFFTSPAGLQTGVTLGGISVAKLYRLDPYFIRYPMQSIGGTLALPSDVEVLVDGQRVSRQRLAAGEFRLQGIQSYGGARNVELLIRDPFGNVQRLDNPFYFSDEPLRQGLQEYSYDLGAIRHDYGSESFDYGPLAGSMFHRWGVSDSWTLGVHASGSGDLQSLGPDAIWVLPRAGVVSVSASASRHDGRNGAAVVADYRYQNHDWSFGLRYRRDTFEFAQLADPVLVERRKYEASAVAGYSRPGLGTLSLSQDWFASYAAAELPPEAQSYLRRTTLAYNVPIYSGHASLNLSVSRVKDAQAQYATAFAGLTWYFDRDHYATASYARAQDGDVETLELDRNQPVGEGLGYQVALERRQDASGSGGFVNPVVQYNARHALLRADYSRGLGGTESGGNAYQLTIAGSLAHAGGHTRFGRPIPDSFGIVEVGDVEDVKVYLNSQEVGRTDADGVLLIPSLSSYNDNRIGIGVENVPIEYSIDAAERYVSPGLRSGSVLRFRTQRLRAVSGRLHAVRNGRDVPAEFLAARLDGSGKPVVFPTGRGGEFYLENLDPGSYAGTLEDRGERCSFTLRVPDSPEPLVQLGEIPCEPATD